MSWPSVRVVIAATNGTRAVFRSEGGNTFTGFSSDLPWVFWTDLGVYCERCEEGLENPDPPGSGDATGPRRPLFLIGSSQYATYLLTYLHRFYAVHKDCQKKEK